MAIMDFLAARAPAVVAACFWLESGFVDRHKIGRPTFCDNAAQPTQIGYTLFRIALLVFQRLFLRVIFMLFSALPITLRSTPT